MAQHQHNYGGPGQPPDEGDEFTTRAFEELNVKKIPAPEVEPDTKQGLDEWGGVKGATDFSTVTGPTRADVKAP